jgi:DNA-binding transcriptional regulator YhcF (GntR family)
LKSDKTSARVYGHLTGRMDEDGVCLVSSNGIAMSLGLPLRTVQRGLRRLDGGGKIVRMGTSRYVVVEQAILDDL